jgi:hypothetical protein
MVTISSKAQVGIFNESPKATLDVTASKTDGTTPEGIITPRLTGDQLMSKDAQYGADQNDCILYITAAVSTPSPKTQNVTQKGYYYYDANASNGSGTGLWLPVGSGGMKAQFYMPSIVLPTDPGSLPDVTNYSYSGTTFTVKLYDIYKQQYGYTSPAGTSARSFSTATLKTFDADKLDYFVTYYDNTVFQGVAVSTAGILTYQLRTGYTVTEKTFMNILFQEK